MHYLVVVEIHELREEVKKEVLELTKLLRMMLNTFLSPDEVDKREEYDKWNAKCVEKLDKIVIAIKAEN